MKKLFSFTFLAMMLSFASFALSPITGPVTICAGNTAYLSDVDSGGTWSSSNALIATVDAYGATTGISAGTATITYTFGGSSVTTSFTVYPVPDPIVETSTTFCTGGTATCTDATAGGTWSSGTAVSITSAGVVTGLIAGVTYINYTLSGCSVTINDTVTGTYAGTLSGPSTICLGSTGTITDIGVTGGSWSSSNTAVATISNAGVVLGIALGTATITYTIPSGSCGVGIATMDVLVSNTTDAGTIYGGSASIAIGSTATLYDYSASATGTWSSSNASIASVDPSTGIVTGLATGTVTITYSVEGCSGLATTNTTITVSATALGPISGCAGSDYYFADSASYGGTWSSSNPAVASVDASGDVTAISAGTATISYYYGGVYITNSFTVYASPAAISESATTLCPGATATCTDATSGGTWSSDNTYVASVSATGVVTAVNGGYAYIYYTLPGGCSVSIGNTVSTPTAGVLTGPSYICVGSTGTIIDSSMITGGAWSSSNSALATVDATGIVTGIAAGTVTISYAVSAICGAAYSTFTMVISNTTDAGTIYGGGSIFTGSTAGLSDYTSGGAAGTGTWSSSNAAVASIDPSSGVVTGVAAGTAVITFSAEGCGGIAVTTATVTVTDLNGISGNVVFGGTPYYGDVTVYLITYNPSTLDLEATDSAVIYCGGTSAYYQFSGLATDSFRVKAAVGGDTFYVATGYVPTYHTSSCYWSAANVIYHVAGTSDLNEDINMTYGSVASGPGFIGGNVTTGANRGTSAGIPAVGLLVFAVNSTTGALVQQTYTDGSGNYTFSNLPLGTYFVYPEALNYGTTAYTRITLTSAAPSMSAASFIQHTLSKTITPIMESVGNVAASASSLVAFPNPTNGKLFLQWKETATEQGTLIITDISGRQVYQTTINMTKGSGNYLTDLSTFTDGLYIVTVQSGNINYVNKIQVQH